jgi:hypothetical protein
MHLRPRRLSCKSSACALGSSTIPGYNPCNKACRIESRQNNTDHGQAEFSIVKSGTWDEAILANHRSYIPEESARKAFDVLVMTAGSASL